MSAVLVVPTGSANIASVVAGLVRAGATPHVTEDPREVARAERLVLPGVGTFGAAMERLTRDGLVELLRARIADGRPTLAVCVGLQVLCAESEESPGVEGLGVVPGQILRFAPTGRLRVPQLGWNRVVPAEGAGFVAEGYAYFANSYRLVDAPPGWTVARTDYGGSFVAALERGDVLACQFHPELSSTWGIALLRRWLRGKGALGC